MSRGELIERIAAHAGEQGGMLEAQAIARDFLRLTAPSAKAAAALVRALLGTDHRFVEEREGVWRCRAERAAALEPPALLVTLDIAPGKEREPWLWRIAGTLWGRKSRVWEHQGAAASADLEELLVLLRDLPAATEMPGALGRWMGAQERLHALPEREPLVIDLRGWRRLLDGSSNEPAAERDEGAGAVPHGAHGTAATRQGAGLAARPRGGRAAAVRETAEGCVESEPGTRLAHLARELERIVAVAAERGLRTWRQVALAPAMTTRAAEESIWDAPRAFTREEVESLPDEPGIYRFFDREGRLLYVGKSAHVRRRVLSYFRPLDAASARRGELLERLHRIETECAPNELEALILEMREIRERSPLLNIRIDLAAPPPETLPGERAMLFILPAVDGGCTVFLLDGERAARVAAAEPLDAERLEEVLRAFFEGGTAAEVEEIAAPERALVRRWLNGGAPGGETLRLTDFSSFRTLALAVAGGTAEGRAEEEPPSAPASIQREPRNETRRASPRDRAVPRDASRRISRAPGRSPE